MPSEPSSDGTDREHEPVDVPADDGRDYREIDDCEGCGAPGSGLFNDRPGVALRGIKMREGRRRMLCDECFVAELERGTVDPTDPRVEGEAVV